MLKSVRYRYCDIIITMTLLSQFPIRIFISADHSLTRAIRAITQVKGEAPREYKRQWKAPSRL